MFRKSRQVISNAINRVVRTLRWQFGRVLIFDVGFNFHAIIRRLIFKTEYALYNFELLQFDVRICIEHLETVFIDFPLIVEPDVVDEKPPTQIEALVQEIDLPHYSTEFHEVNFDLSALKLFSMSSAFGIKTEYRDQPLSKYSVSVFSLSSEMTPTVKDGYSAAFTIPLIRTSLSIYRMAPNKRLEYWKELIAQVHKQPKELELLGIFQNVPHRGVSKALIDSVKGELRIWCNNKSIDGPAGTLIVARERSTGKIFRIYDRRTLQRE